jgi:hypothetical protein
MLRAEESLSSGILNKVRFPAEFIQAPAGARNDKRTHFFRNRPNRARRPGSTHGPVEERLRMPGETPRKSTILFSGLHQCPQPPRDHRRIWRIVRGNGRLVLRIGVGSPEVRRAQRIDEGFDQGSTTRRAVEFLLRAALRLHALFFLPLHFFLALLERRFRSCHRIPLNFAR